MQRNENYVTFTKQTMIWIHTCSGFQPFDEISPVVLACASFVVEGNPTRTFASLREHPQQHSTTHTVRNGNSYKTLWRRACCSIEGFHFSLPNVIGKLLDHRKFLSGTKCKAETQFRESFSSRISKKVFAVGRFDICVRACFWVLLRVRT